MAMISPVDSRMGSTGDGLNSPTGGNAYENSDTTGLRSPLHMNLGFLKNLTEKKTTRGIYRMACLQITAFRLPNIG